MNKENARVASENDDGTFSIEGTDLRLSPEEFKKLQHLQGGRWVVFRNYGVKGKNVIRFDLAK